MDHLQIIADALRLVIEQSYTGSGYLNYHVKSKDDGGTRYVTGSRNDVAIYLARTIRVDRQSVALRQQLDQQQIDLLEARLKDPRPYAEKYKTVELVAAKADRQEKLDLLEEFKSEDFKGLPRP